MSTQSVTPTRTETKTSEGTVAFHVPGLTQPAHTWYKTFGDLRNTQKTPLIVLHGGPGACHDYLLPLTDLLHDGGPPLVFYDQIGNGRSTHLPDRAGDEEFWSVRLFIDELDNLLRALGLDGRPIDIYGHSWGGMLAAEWAVASSTTTTLSSSSSSSPNGNLRRLVLSNSLASMDTWRTGVNILRERLPAAARQALDEADQTGTFSGPAYDDAIGIFYKRHLSLARPWPAPEVQAALDWFETDATTYGTMYGPSELTITGSLRNWTIIPRLHRIKVPTLLLNGAQDEAQDVAMRPFFRHVENSTWITLDDAAHFSHVDQREKYIKILKDFLERS